MLPPFVSDYLQNITITWRLNPTALTNEAYVLELKSFTSTEFAVCVGEFCKTVAKWICLKIDMARQYSQ